MPIEIRELHIRVTVNAPDGGGNATAQPATRPPSAGSGSADKDALIAECVEQVLNILQEKQER